MQAVHGEIKKESLHLRTFWAHIVRSKYRAQVPACTNRWIDINYPDTSASKWCRSTWPAAVQLKQKMPRQDPTCTQPQHSRNIQRGVAVAQAFLLLLLFCQHVFIFLQGIVTQEPLSAVRAVWTSAFLSCNGRIQRHSEPPCPRRRPLTHFSRAIWDKKHHRTRRKSLRRWYQINCTNVSSATQPGASTNLVGSVCTYPFGEKKHTIRANTKFGMMNTAHGVWVYRQFGLDFNACVLQ